MARQTKAELAAAQQAELKAAQQAELKRLRAERAAKTRAANKAAANATTVEHKAVAAHMAGVQPEASAADIENLMADLQLPSAKRVLVGVLLGVAAAGGVGYGIGMLLAYAIAGIVTLTSTAWVAFALTVVAWVIALYASWKIGSYIGGKVFASVVLPDGLASRSYESLANAAVGAKQSLGSVFASSKAKVAERVEQSKATVAAAFSGAHVVQAAA